MKKDILLLAIITTVLIGCGKGGDGNAVTVNRSGYPIVDEPITLSVAVKKRALHGSYREMEYFKELEAKTNIQLQWNEIPDTFYKEKINLLINSGDMPDIILSEIPKELVFTFASQGLIIPLNDLIDQWAPNIVETYNQYPDFKRSTTSPNGMVYSLGRIQDQDFRLIPENAYINRSWLKSLGLSMPETVDELYHVLKAFKERDPNGNGKSDEIPLSFRYGEESAGHYSLYGMFGMVSNEDHIIVRDGRVIFVPLQQEYREAERFFSKLYQEGLIDREIFTQDEKQIAAKGKEFPMVLGVFTDWSADNVVGMAARDKDYTPLPPIKDKNGEQMWASKPHNIFEIPQFFISSTNPSPEASIRLANEFFTEDGAFQLTWGAWNINIERQEDGSVTTLPPPEGLSSDEFRFKNSPAHTVSTSFTEEHAKAFIPPLSQQRKSIDNQTYSPYVRDSEIYPLVNFTPQESERLSILKVDIDNYIKTMSAQWYTGESRVDDDWDSFVTTLKRIGVEQLIEIYQAALDRYNESS